MLLAIDIGNTNIVIGVFAGEKLKATYSIGTSIYRVTDDYVVLLLNLLRARSISPSQITDAIICSVVPPLESTFIQLCEQYLGITPMQVVAGLKTGVRIRIDNPKEVGADRLVNAVAAHHFYNGHIIVIDFGTAITFDVISKEGDYLGGAIAPGMNISAEALFLQAGTRPRVALVPPKQVIGKNTVDALQSGIVFGYVGMVEGIITRVKRELVGEVQTVATGDIAGVIAPHTSMIKNIHPNLALLGLRIIYDMNTSQVFSVKQPRNLKPNHEEDQFIKVDHLDDN